MGNAIEWIILSGLLVALSNFCMRKSIDVGGTSKHFLMIQLTLVFFMAIFLNPIRTGHYTWSTSMFLFGLLGGAILTWMLSLLGKALECGPPGLTFVILNCSTVMPALVMLLFFGSKYGYVYTLYHALGSFLVVIGLIWAGKEVVKKGKKGKWLMLAGGAFICHVIFLVFMQWRALFIHYPGDDGLFLSFDVADAKSQWFMPAVFLAAAGFQWSRQFIGAKVPFKPKEVMWGTFGGIANGIGTFFLILATEVATGKEPAMIFPIYSVIIVIFTNLWGQLIYKEKVNWLANSLCVLGIIIGTTSWEALLG